MRALVVGGDGRIGSALCARLLELGHIVVKTTRRDLDEAVRWSEGTNEGTIEFDLRDNESIVEFDLRDLVLPYAAWMPMPDVVYLIAGIAGAIDCERNSHAWLINAEAPVALAQQAQARGRRVVFLTSGAPEVAPHTALAMQKSYAGLAVLLLGGCVVRPVPAVPPEKYAEVADLLVRVGEEGRAGLVRWEG